MVEFKKLLETSKEISILANQLKNLREKLDVTIFQKKFIDAFKEIENELILISQSDVLSINFEQKLKVTFYCFFIVTF